MHVELPLVLAALFGSSLAKSNCFGGSQHIPLDKIDALREDIAQNTFNMKFPLEVKAQPFQETNEGDARLCISNNYLFDNTHVAQDDVVAAIDALRVDCIGFGGTFQIHGDSGLAVNVVITDRSGRGC